MAIVNIRSGGSVCFPATFKYNMKLELPDTFITDTDLDQLQKWLHQKMDFLVEYIRDERHKNGSTD